MEGSFHLEQLPGVARYRTYYVEKVVDAPVALYLDAFSAAVNVKLMPQTSVANDDDDDVRPHFVVKQKSSEHYCYSRGEYWPPC